jgi:PAS domain S-box-containing protein
MTTKDDDVKRPRSTARQRADSIHAARQRAEQRREFYLAEAQRLAHIGSWELNPAGAFEYWSPELFRIYGLDPANGTPTPLELLTSVQPQDRGLLAAAIDAMLRDGSGCDVKLRIVRPDGERRHIRCVGASVVDEGVVQGFVGTTIDVTEQEQLTHELRRREALLTEAQRLSHTGSFGWVTSTDEVFWSEETFRIFQYHRTTKPTVELVVQRVHPDDAALMSQTIERATREGKDFELEHRLVMPDGSIKHVRVAAHASNVESGSVEYAGAVMDVTEQHQASAALEKAFDEIKKSEDRLRLAIDTIPGMVWSARPDGSVDFVNKPWMEYHGLSWDDLSRPGWVPPIHPDDIAESVDIWRAAVATGRPSEHELRGRRADGEYRWFLSRVVPLRDELGHIVKWYGTITDIEDRKRAEMLLAGEKRLLEMIARGDSRPVVLDASCRLYEELASGSLSSILLLDPTTNCLRHGAAPSLPAAYIKAIDGSVIGPSAGSCGTAAYRAEPVIVSDIATDPLWADYRELALAHGLRACWSTPILSMAGKVLGTFATYYREPRSPTPREQSVIEQITHLASIAVEREQAEAKLRSSEEQWRDVFENNPTMYFMVDAAGAIMAVNPFGAEQLGYDVDELVGQSVLNVFRVSDRDEVQRNVAECLKQLGRARSWEARKVRKDGTVLSVRETAKAVPRANGPIVLVACEDITEQKRAAEALRQAQSDLAHVSRVTTMGELTASVAHEVNQPIAAAVTNANACVRWLDRDAPNLEEARAAAMRMVKDGTRAADIISRIRLLFNKGTPEQELVDVNGVIREMIVLLRSEATRYSILLRTELAADLPQAMGDRVQLQQVMMNLIMNGIDAMKDVGGTRELTIKSQWTDHHLLGVSVSDTGVGLPRQWADQIFDAFFTTKRNGTGMGLSISRSIVESHGGRLWAADNAPRGASFHLTLPLPARLG